MARNFAQNGVMSTTRSLTTGRFPIAEITGTWPDSAISYMRVLQASTAAPSIRMPQEPQIIIRQLFRNARVPEELPDDDLRLLRHADGRRGGARLQDAHVRDRRVRPCAGDLRDGEPARRQRSGRRHDPVLGEVPRHAPVAR